MTLAKGITSGYVPLSAVMIGDRVANVLIESGEFDHGFTYSGHPVPAAVAIETLKIYDETEIGAHVKRVGPHLQRQLRERFADHPLIGEVRGIGMVAAIINAVIGAVILLVIIGLVRKAT